MHYAALDAYCLIDTLLKMAHYITDGNGINEHIKKHCTELTVKEKAKKKKQEFDGSDDDNDNEETKDSQAQKKETKKAIKAKVELGDTKTDVQAM
jgi:hypothetical protein